MQEALLPGLSPLHVGHLRNAWSEHIEQGLPVPSVDTHLKTYEVEHLEHDYMRAVREAPGREAERRLGKRETPNYATFSPQAGHTNARIPDFENGLRAVIRLIATGKNFGSSDLQELIDGGPAEPVFADVFDGAVKDLMRAQQNLCVRRNDRVQFAPELSRAAAYEPHLPGFDFGR